MVQLARRKEKATSILSRTNSPPLIHPIASCVSKTSTSHSKLNCPLPRPELLNLKPNFHPQLSSKTSICPTSNLAKPPPVPILSHKPSTSSLIITSPLRLASMICNSVYLKKHPCDRKLNLNQYYAFNRAICLQEAGEHNEVKNALA